MINIIIYQQIMIKTLIVDDNLPFVKNILNTVLSKFDNINISHIATSGEEALNIISTNNIDLIFLDLKLPDFDGIELIKKMATLNTIKFPKIIVISGELSLLGDFIHSVYISNIINKVDSTESIYNSIKETINEINYLNNKEDIKNKVLSELINLGYSLKHKGTYYILETIIYIYLNNDLNLLDNLEKNVYTYIAHQNNKSVNNVKTNIIKSTNQVSKHNSFITPKQVVSNIVIKLSNDYKSY